MGKNLQITHPNNVIHQGTNFRIANKTDSVAKYTFNHHKRVMGFVNVPSSINVQIALNLALNDDLSAIGYGFGSLDQRLLDDPSCYRPLSTNKKINVYSLEFIGKSPDSCNGRSEIKRPYYICSKPAVPGVDWAGCDKRIDKGSAYTFTPQTKIRDAILEGAMFDSNIQGEDLRGVNFKGVDLLSIEKPKIIGHRVNGGFDPIGILDGADFSGFKAIEPHLVGYISKVKFINSNLSKSTINSDGHSRDRTDLYNSDFTGSNQFFKKLTSLFQAKTADLK